MTVSVKTMSHDLLNVESVTIEDIKVDDVFASFRRAATVVNVEPCDELPDELVIDFDNGDFLIASKNEPASRVRSA